MIQPKRNIVKMVVGIATVTLLSAWLAAWLLELFGPGADEAGIRVKNGGSIHVETVSGMGFKLALSLTRWPHFKSAGQSRGSFTLTVKDGQCNLDPPVLTAVTNIAVGLTTGGFEVDDHGDRFHVHVNWFTWDQLKNGAIGGGTKDTFLKSVQASGSGRDGRSATLSCTFVTPREDSAAKPEIWLDVP